MDKLNNTALKIAENLISDGKINDIDNWEEMKLELEHHLDNQNYLIPLTAADKEEMIQTVKTQWYE